MMTVAASVVAGVFAAGLPATASESAYMPAVDLVEEINGTVKAYRALVDSTAGKLASPAFDMVEAFRRDFSLRGCAVSAKTELGLLDLKFVVSGQDEVLVGVQKELASRGYKGVKAERALHVVVQAFADPAPIHQLMTRVIGINP